MAAVKYEVPAPRSGWSPAQSGDPEGVSPVASTLSYGGEDAVLTDPAFTTDEPRYTACGRIPERMSARSLSPAGFEPATATSMARSRQRFDRKRIGHDAVTVDGTRIRYAYSNSGARQLTLLTRPWPESVYAFAPTWPSLEQSFGRAAALDTIEGCTLPNEIRADYLDSYAGDRFGESTRHARRSPEQRPELSARLPGIQTTVQIIAGARDRVVPPANAEFLDDARLRARSRSSTPSASCGRGRRDDSRVR